MEECNICFLEKSFFQSLSCGHKLCSGCFKKLPKTQCPFCRTEFTLTEKIMKRGTNNTNPPIIPPIITTINLDFYSEEDEDDDNNLQIPFASYYRQMYRRRRRTLTFEEVKERRQRIKKRERMKWERREARMEKMNGYQTL
jgi:hypothetical protein